jgi:hypothetical protein
VRRSVAGARRYAVSEFLDAFVNLDTRRLKNHSVINTCFAFRLLPLPRDKISESAEVAVSKSDSKSGGYEFRTKSTQSGGLETDGHRERGSGLSRRVAVRRFVPEARSYWASMRAQSQQRKLVSAGLAERVGFEITVRFSPRGVCEHIGTA